MPSYTAKDRYILDTAARYDDVRRGSPGHRRKWNSELSTVDKVIASLPQCSSMLDVPCGTGRFFPTMLEHARRVVGVDISQDMIRNIPAIRLEASDDLRTVLGDAEQLPFPDLSYDYLLCMRFFNHLPDETRHRVLKEFARVSRRGIIIEVRFRGRISPFESGIGEAVRGRLRSLRDRFREMRRSTENKAQPPRCGPRKPRFSEFRAMVESHGLRVAEVHAVNWGLTLNPMKICLLVPRHPDA